MSRELRFRKHLALAVRYGRSRFVFDGVEMRVGWL